MCLISEGSNEYILYITKQLILYKFCKAAIVRSELRRERFVRMAFEGEKVDNGRVITHSVCKLYLS